MRESHLADRMVLFSACVGMLLLFALVAVYVGSLFLHSVEERETWSRIHFGEVLLRKIGIEDYVYGVGVILGNERLTIEGKDEIEDVIGDRLATLPPGEWLRLPPTERRVAVGLMHWPRAQAEREQLLARGERLAQIDTMVLRTTNAELRSLLFDMDGSVLITVPAPGRVRDVPSAAVENAAKPVLSFLGIAPIPTALGKGEYGCSWRPSATDVFASRTLYCMRTVVSQATGKAVAIVGAAASIDTLFANSLAREQRPDRYAYFSGDGTLLVQTVEGESEHPVLKPAKGRRWWLGPDGLYLSFFEPGNPDGWHAVTVYSLTGVLLEQASHLSIAMLVLLVGTGVVLGSAWRLHARVVMPARRQAAQLRESETFYRTALRTAPVGLATLRRSDGELLDANALGGELLSDHQVRRDILLREAELGAAGGDPVSGIEIAWRTPEQQVRALSVAAAHLEFRGQQALFCAVTDVSLYKSLVLDIAKAKREADAASEAKSGFLAAMSHEIRTPLYGMLGSLELIEQGELDARQRERIGAVQRSSEALLQIVNDMLDFSKIEAGELALREEVLDPVELVEDVVRGMAPLAIAKELALICCIQPGLTKLRGDPLRLRQILSNLLSNALKFTERGRVLVSLAAEPAGPRSALELRVVDTGPGISRGEQARLFTPFMQGESGHARGGTGLGLPICKQLAEMMKGHIDVASERFLGSSFTLRVSLLQEAPIELPSLAGLPPVRIELGDPDLEACLAALVTFCNGRLPANDAEAQEAIVLTDAPSPAASGPRVRLLPDAPQTPELVGGVWQVSAYSQRGVVEALIAASGAGAPAAATGPGTNAVPQLGLNVLVAEDHPINRHLLRDQLEALGCRAVVAGDGQEALAHWHASNFDLLLTDVNMPVCNGLELARTLRGQGVSKPIVGVTARFGDESQCLDAGMDACIMKPVSIAALGAALRPFAARVGIGPAPAGAEPLLSANMRQTIVGVLREDMGKLAALLEAAEHAQAGAEAHRLKGALASLGAAEAAAACAALERELGGLDLAGIKIRFETLQREVTLFMEALG